MLRIDYIGQIVSSKSFYEVSKDCGLDDFILLGKGESKTGGKRRLDLKL